MDVEALLKQSISEERQLHFPSFDAEDAWNLGTILVELARKNRWELAISIESNDKQLFYYAFQQTHLNNESAVKRKRNVAHVFRCSSLRVFCELRLSQTSIADRGRDFQQYLPLGGSFPIYVEGTGQVGTVTVSGLDHVDDHRAVVEGIQMFLEYKRGGKLWSAM